jgi:hypothetical protein
VQALAVHGEEQRRALQDQPPDRQGALEGEDRLPGRVVAGVRGNSVYAVVLQRGKGIKAGA